MLPCDVLLIGPHPDDVELAAAGTILRLIAAGHTVSIVDLTRGEKGSRGTVQDRDAEAGDAAKALGLRERHNLGLPDTGVSADDAATGLLVAAIRSARPNLLFSPHARDVHPDHVAAAALAERAFFLAGLVHWEPAAGPPHRPRLHIRYPGNTPVEPSFVVDIADLQERKADVIRCYRSQLRPADRSHLTQGLDILERTQVRDRFHGTRIGCAAAEAFCLDGPLPLRDLRPLMG
ncbi:MAG: bacillithiol biosynthesis deacetylase BshB1 [Planctomycetes bacterium]|nr:bacillithiol biosynthesis deacetylase BshB1 [Planctomycetota bacterium]